MLWSQLCLCRSLTVPARAPCPAMLAAEAIGAAKAIGVAETIESDKFLMEKLLRIISRGNHPLGKDRGSSPKVCHPTVNLVPLSN